MRAKHLFLFSGESSYLTSSRKSHPLQCCSNAILLIKSILSQITESLGKVALGNQAASCRQDRLAAIKAEQHGQRRQAYSTMTFTFSFNHGPRILSLSSDVKF